MAGLVSRATDQLGSIEVLVVNATGPQPVVPLEELSWQDHLDQLLFFVKSPTLLVQAVLPGMKERGRGRIVQIGSDIFERAVPGMSAYVAAKGAQLGLTRSWARELGPFGITVNYVAPGWIPVERHADSLADGLRRYRDQVPLGRMGSAGRHRRGRVVPRVRLSILHHRRAADRERRPHDRLILSARAPAPPPRWPSRSPPPTWSSSRRDPFLRERLLQGARTQAHRGLDGGARRDRTCPCGKPVGIWCCVGPRARCDQACR